MSKKPALPEVHIPQEIIIEILGNLPVKTLLRFKSVCKLWQAIISDPGFNLSSKGRGRAIFRCYQREQQFYSLDKEAFAQKLPNPIGVINSKNLKFFGSCNGLVLFCTWNHYVNHQNRMYLWNPSTNCCKELTHLGGLIETCSPYRTEILASGLYLDKCSNRYKAVVMGDYRSAYGDYKSTYFVDLSESKQSGGRALTEIVFPYDCRIFGLGISANGHLHWVAQEFIVGFDEGKHEFNKLPSPELRDHESISGLGELEGCLCMFRIVGEDNHDCEVLVMKQYGVRESWTVLFNISYRNSIFITSSNSMSSFIFPAGFDKDDCVVILATLDGGLAYNSKDQSFKKFQPPAHSIMYYPLVYVESLASIHLPQIN